MPGALERQVVVVTGASSGIGRATALELDRRGAHVVGTGRDRAALTDLAASSRVWTVTSDQRDPDAGAELIQATLDRYGRLDTLVCNAGVGYAGRFDEMPPQRLAELVDVNLRGTLLVARAALPVMAEQRRGLVVVVTSVAGLLGVPHEAAYSATKAGLSMACTVLAEETRGTGVQVVEVVPGVVDTPFFARRGSPYLRRRPRPLPPEAVAAVIVDLVGAAAEGRRATGRRVVPRWLVVPARLAATAPRVYQALAQRFG